MKTLAAVFLLGLASLHAVELTPIPHSVIADDQTYERAATDREYSVWTTDPATAQKLAAQFGLNQDKPLAIKPGEIFAIFFNDTITEDLVQITHNRTAGQIFADYADSGIQFKLRAPNKGKKYSHLTAVVFTPPEKPGHLGLRGMMNGLSKKE